MDLVSILRSRIEELPEGDYSLGLKAVMLHIETAFRHLSRGQSADDETAFTDAIYRTNQAFEGSIKEAYRVLARQDPDKKRPFDIESYLEKKSVFRPRVLSQFTTYRTEWRNPSSHDCKLDFDESEAFLAIVSVCAFSCLLLDQISEHISFDVTKAQADQDKTELHPSPITKTVGLREQVVETIQKFCQSYLPHQGTVPPTETQVVGALHGFFASTLPALKVQIEAKLSNDRPFRADMIVSDEKNQVLIELKRRFHTTNYQGGLAQVEQYLVISGIKEAVLFYIPTALGTLESLEHKVTQLDASILVLRPADPNRYAPSKLPLLPKR